MRLFICLMVILIASALFTSGCTQQQSRTSLPDVTNSGGLGTEEGSIDQYPAPPADIAVSAQINEKDQLDKTISVFFSGGNGQKMVKSVWIIMKRSDGRIERVTLAPRVQSEVILNGTDGEDLIRVYAEFFNGNTYQIAEKTVKGMRQRV